MDSLFTELVLKLLPLLLLVGLGFVATRRLAVSPESIAKLLIYILTPVVGFTSIIRLEFTPSLLLLPVLVFLTSCAMTFVSYQAGGLFFEDSRRNIAAYSSSTGNTGYFGIPLVSAVLGEPAVGILLLAVMGINVYELTVGFYITARGSLTVRDAFLRTLKIPFIYAATLAVILQLLHVPAPQFITDLSTKFIGAYSVLGMMLVGMGMSGVRGMGLDLKFTAFLFFFRFVVWPIVFVAIVLWDRASLQLLPEQAHAVLLLLSVVPLAANSVALATELKVQPAKMAYAVLLSTVFAIFYIPLMVIWVLPFA